jgi:hypothetical protein
MAQVAGCKLVVHWTDPRFWHDLFSYIKKCIKLQNTLLQVLIILFKQIRYCPLQHSLLQYIVTLQAEKVYHLAKKCLPALMIIIVYSNVCSFRNAMPFLLKLCRTHHRLLLLLLLLLSGITTLYESEPPQLWGYEITHNDTTQSVGLLCTSDQPVAETSTWQHTQHSQQTNIHAPGGIRTRNPSRRAATDPRLRPLGLWDRPVELIGFVNMFRVYLAYNYSGTSN